MTDETEYTEEPSIWGQASDIDFLGLATGVEKHEECVIEDGGAFNGSFGAFDNEDSYEEDTSLLELE